jgi:hypothetical protein
VPRLATCHVCHVIERMPDVPDKIPLIPAVLEWTTGERHIIRDDDGLPKMVPMYDPMLESFVIKHDHDMPDKMITHADQIQIIQVDQKTWDAMDILTKVKSELQQTTGEVYTENQEYREAAIKCYQAHGSPDLGDGCSDYMSESKQIGQWNYDDGEGHKITIPPQYRQYMCHLCPFAHAYVAVELRRRKGMYKEGPVMKRKRVRRR